ncbi:hypothetical protein JCM3765_002699 [Sporobolomyces pararoseus]
MPINVTSDIVHLSLGEFSSASVALKGATLFSYKQNSLERLFTSSTSSTLLSDPLPIRGGVPICWPIFGPPPSTQDQENGLFSKLKQHGFARISKWDFLSSESECLGTKGVKAVFKLESNSTTITSLFSLPFLLKYTVELLPTCLNLSLSVHSPSDSIAPLPFQALLHCYFLLPQSISPSNVLITPLENLSYLDKVSDDPKEEKIETRKVVNVDGPGGEVDRVYLRSSDKLKIYYENQPGSIELRKKNLADVVLWNPGKEKAKLIKDMESNGETKYVCLEPGQTSSWVNLEPGQTWKGSLEIFFNDNDNVNVNENNN